MPNSRSSPKVGCAVLGLVILAGVVICSLVVVPGLINSKAEALFGTASPQLSFRQHLYLSAMLVLQSRQLTEPVNPTGSSVDFSIDRGESVPSIAANLQAVGLISDPQVFTSYLMYTGLDTSLKAGEYTLDPAMTPIEIAQAIQSSVSADVTLAILPGWRAEEIANSLPTTGLTITPQEFLDAVHTHPEGYSFSSCMADDSLEGYLFPGSYTLPRETTLASLLSQVLMNFETLVTPDLKNAISSHNLDLCQAVTLASIVQREAVVNDEMPVIASVFYNRLEAGATLASDPTVQYALGYNEEQGTWWTNPLSRSDLQVDSPYNTYTHPALPPGPISNPGLEALKAVAYPSDTPYYYFRAACDGSGRHVFSESYDEHLANACP